MTDENRTPYLDFHASEIGDAEGRRQLERGITLAIRRRAQKRPQAFSADKSLGGGEGTRLDLYRVDDRTVRLRFNHPAMTPEMVEPRGVQHIASVDATVRPDRDAVTDAAKATGTSPQQAARYAVIQRVAGQSHKYAGPLLAAYQQSLHAAPDVAADRHTTPADTPRSMTMG